MRICRLRYRLASFVCDLTPQRRSSTMRSAWTGWSSFTPTTPRWSSARDSRCPEPARKGLTRKTLIGSKIFGRDRTCRYASFLLPPAGLQSIIAPNAPYLCSIEEKVINGRFQGCQALPAKSRRQARNSPRHAIESRKAGRGYAGVRYAGRLHAVHRVPD